ncbi:DUF835 domain-containing protein [[Eubacterium] cellulosolvens]
MITFICSIILATYIYILNHENLANKMFIVFMSGIALISFLDFSQTLSSIEYLALFFAKFKYSMILFIATFFLHLSSALSDNEFFVANRKYIFIPYLISIIFFIITIFTNFIVSGVELTNEIYDTSLTSLGAFLISTVVILLISGLVILIITFKKTKNKEKRMQLKYIFYGMTITVIFFIFFDQIMPEVSNYEIKGSIILTLPMFIFYAYAIAKYKLLKVPTLIQERDIQVKPIEYEIEPGYTYIIPEKEPELGFQLFAKTLSEGVHGICITMRSPLYIRNKYGLKKTPIISISKKKYDDYSVKPEEIASINELLEPYFEDPENSVIFLIDDKTITSSTQLEEHSKILELSQKFFDTIVRSNSRFIISVSPTSISPSKRKDITKTKSPLIEFTRLAAFVFEDICNSVLQFLIRNGYIRSEDIPKHLNNLGNKDKFFKSLRYRRSGNPITSNGNIKFTNILVAQRLSKQVLIDKIKSFISEFENIETAMDLNSIAISYIKKYGLSKNEFLLHPGDAYIIPEPDAQKSFEIFSEFVSKDYKGLCITKSNPKKIRRKYNLTDKGLEIFWLTDIGESRKGVLPPKLEHILSAIEDFIAEKQEKKRKKVILLDGIEYLISYSGDNFDSVLGFLRQVTDRISETNGLILIPINTNIVSEERIGLLTRSGMELYQA